MLITGPTKGGIGAAFAKSFARQGFNLVLLGRTSAKVNEIAKVSVFFIHFCLLHITDIGSFLFAFSPCIKSCWHFSSVFPSIPI